MAKVSRLPWFRVLAAVQIALLAHRHLQALTPHERRRLAELARRPHRLSRHERRELRQLASKLEPRAFATAAAREFSPVGMPGRHRKR
jgi:hypothetical protein